MVDIRSILAVGVRRSGLLAVLAGAAMLLAPQALIPGAAARTRSARADLSLGAAAGDRAAGGRMVLRRGRRGERLRIRLENLAPRREYEIRDGSTGDVLGSLRTNRRGRARKSLRSGRDGPGFAGLDLRICERGNPDPVLEGRVPGSGNADPGWDEGTLRIGTVATGDDARVAVSLTLTSYAAPDGDASYDSISLFVGPGGVWAMAGGDPAVPYGRDGGNGTPGRDGGDGGPDLPEIPGPVTFWIEGRGGALVKVATVEQARTFAEGGVDVRLLPSPPFYSWSADNARGGDGLPLGAGSVDDLSGRAFEVRDGEGTVLLDGTLPRLEDAEPDPRPEPDPDPRPWTCGGDPSVTVCIQVGKDGITVTVNGRILELPPLDGIDPADLDPWRLLELLGIDPADPGLPAR